MPQSTEGKSQVSVQEIYQPSCYEGLNVCFSLKKNHCVSSLLVKVNQNMRFTLPYDDVHTQPWRCRYLDLRHDTVRSFSAVLFPLLVSGQTSCYTFLILSNLSLVHLPDVSFSHSFRSFSPRGVRSSFSHTSAHTWNCGHLESVKQRGHGCPVIIRQDDRTCTESADGDFKAMPCSISSKEDCKKLAILSRS